MSLPEYFDTGGIIITPSALILAKREKVNLLDLLVRHTAGYYGDVGDDRKALNEIAIPAKGTVESRYNLPTGGIIISTSISGNSTIIAAVAHQEVDG